MPKTMGSVRGKYVGCFIYEELKKLIDVKVRCIRNFSAEERFHYIAEDASKFNNEFHYDAPSLKIWHQFDFLWRCVVFE